MAESPLPGRRSPPRDAKYGNERRVASLSFLLLPPDPLTDVGTGTRAGGAFWGAVASLPLGALAVAFQAQGHRRLDGDGVEAAGLLPAPERVASCRASVAVDAAGAAEQ